jgi:1,4-alpha-glucan branching enzyme
MVTTNMHELMQVVSGEHADPHHVLGMHDITFEKEEFTVVRAFCPGAVKIEVFDPKKAATAKNCHLMEQEHTLGFFSVAMPKQKHFRYKLR